jgi:hypothetical protein
MALGLVLEITMHLKFDHFDGRSWNVKDVIDEDTGKQVGHIRSDGVGFGNIGGIEISLFDGKYEATVSSYKECVGFVKGVQAVLNRMISADDGRRQLEHQLNKLKEERHSWLSAKASV